MLIKLNNTYYKIHSDENGLWVDVPERGAVRENTLSSLINRLEFMFDNVSLPQNLFTDDLFVLDEFIRLGFDKLEQQTINISGFRALLKPYGYWTSKAVKASQETDRKRFRLYQAKWTDDEGRTWAQIFTEDELATI